jgi:hypothetical protein
MVVETKTQRIASSKTFLRPLCVGADLRRELVAFVFVMGFWP